MSEANHPDDGSLAWHRRAGLVLGPLVAVAMLVLPPPEGLSAQGWSVATVGVWMALWWMTEAVPLAVTALLPLVLFPLLGVSGMDAAARPYANPLIFLFLGGFLLARAMRVWGLERRLALAVLSLAGNSPSRVVGGLMAVTAFLSMWVSNTATAMVMLPIGLSVVGFFAEQEDAALPPALLLGIAYAATIGGMGTIIGTPPNALFVAFMQEAYGIEIGFLRWMLIGVPAVLVLLPVTWWLLTRLAFRVGRLPALGVAAAIQAQRAALPPMAWADSMVAAVMGLVALGWLTRPLYEAVLPLDDAGIALVGALALFVLPADLGRGRFLLHWSDAASIRWDVLILFGGGLSLAAVIGASDLEDWLGARLTGLGALPALALLLLLGVLIVLLGELASNTAMAAVFLPVAGAAAVAMGEPALSLTLPVALFASLGFMLPVATPPNAVIFGSGMVSMGQMLRAGAILDAVGIVVATMLVLTLAPVVFG